MYMRKCAFFVQNVYNFRLTALETPIFQKKSPPGVLRACLVSAVYQLRYRVGMLCCTKFRVYERRQRKHSPTEGIERACRSRIPLHLPLPPHAPPQAQNMPWNKKTRLSRIPVDNTEPFRASAPAPSRRNRESPGETSTYTNPTRNAFVLPKPGDPLFQVALLSLAH